MRKRSTTTATERTQTPLRRQFLDIKRHHPDAILLFRLGDFYEMFGDDAEAAAEILHIVLTSREFGRGNRVPMCGVPHHAAHTYIAKLIEAGRRVAVCDQVGEAGNGLVERKVTRVITPGTIVDEAMLQPEANNYLCAVVADGDRLGFAYADVTTGEFSATELAADQLPRELTRVAPRETLLFAADAAAIDVPGATAPAAWMAEAGAATEALTRTLGVSDLEGLGLGGRPLAARAAGAVLAYLEDTDADALHVLTGVHVYSASGFMELDPFTRGNLELESAGRDGRLEGSLLWVLDQTKTPMGARLLRRRLGRPSLAADEIDRRLDRVQALVDQPDRRAELRSQLARLGDLERLGNRLARRSARVVDLRHLLAALQTVAELRAALETGPEPLESLRAAIDPCDGAVDVVGRAITESGGRAIRAGYSDELDRIAGSAAEAKGWIADLERSERERTGLKALKVGFNRVFGYYLEVGRAHAESVPPDYQRRQTLANTERYITPELKEYESLVLNSEERIAELERALFGEVLERLQEWVPRVLATASALAELDLAAALADVAVRNRYVRPEVADDDTLEIAGGRHPVVEATQTEPFVPNDARLNPADDQIMVLTGPNMAGKSTYLRQVALIALLAQIGSFVPAERARIGLVDRIFTRVGARDDLSAGASTFMVEMLELAAILSQATPRSLLVLDEIGRGTSTYDGISVAQAVIEHLHNHPRLRAKTIFATHYHELTAVAGVLPRVHNFNVAVAEQEGRVVFLRRIVAGPADRSYGVHVAELAGLPSTVIRRAHDLLVELERQAARNGTLPHETQLSLFPPDEHPAAARLRGLDLDQLSPLEALNTLYELQNISKP